MRSLLGYRRVGVSHPSYPSLTSLLPFSHLPLIVQVRIFELLTGKLYRVYDESLDVYTQSQQVCVCEEGETETETD